MSGIEEEKEQKGIQVIARAAAILRSLKADPGGMSLGQIATAVSLPRSTVQRIVGALQAERLVIADADRGGLRLGPEVRALADATRSDTVELCRGALLSLSETTGETADLSALQGAQMVFLDQVPGRHRLRTVSYVGEVFPLTTTANGQACLAQLKPARAEELIRREWARTGHSGDMAAMRSVLAGVRESGLAYDMNAHTPGISAIGIAFTDRTGVLHAISVPTPATRFDDVREAVETALQRTRRDVMDLMSRQP